MFFDSHAHYCADRFDADRYELLDSLPSQGVDRVINVLCGQSEHKSGLELIERYDYMYGAAGVHPHESGEESLDNLAWLEHCLAHPKVVALGEIGLDFHYDFSPRDVQREFFTRQMGMARELKMPVVIHDREAHQECYETAKRIRCRGVFHCYSGSAEMARELIKLGYYISFSGSVTFKNARKVVEAAQAVPLERMLIETDCPYLAPEPFRGRRNDSSLLRHTAQRIADIKGVSLEEVAQATSANAGELFGV